MKRRPAHPLVCVAVLAAGVLGGCGSEQPADLPDAGVYAREVFDSTNEVRASEGLSPLMWDGCLAQEALERADAVKDAEILEHAPLTVQCTDGDLAGENLSRVEGDPDEVVRQWMDSSSHAANILTASFEDGAVGCVPAQRALACSWLAEGHAGEGSVIE